MCRKGEQSGCPGKGYAGQGLACDTLGVVWCGVVWWCVCSQCIYCAEGQSGPALLPSGDCHR